MLYYRDPLEGQWVLDPEAVQAGVVNGSLYRLQETGALWKDGLPEDQGVARIVLTDSEVLRYYRTSEAAPERLRASDFRTAETAGSYFRSPLTVEYRQAHLLDDHGCQTGQVLEGSECVFVCAGYVSRGDTCLRELGAHMQAQSGRIAVCESGFVFDATGESCVCGAGTAETRLGGSCVADCDANEHAVDGRCVCVEDAFVDAATGKCVLRGECTHVAEYGDGREECL